MKSKSQTSLTKGATAVDVEIVGPSWDRARKLLESLRLHLRLSLAVQVCIGHELAHLKKELGFAGSGRRKEPTMGSLNRTWDDWCKSELGVGKSTADRWIDSYEGVKVRLRRLGGEARLLTILDTPPAKLDEEAQKTLSAAVDKTTDGASQKDLLEELRLVKAHEATKGGKTDKEEKDQPSEEQKIGQLAFAFFQPLGESLAQLHACPEYKAYLAALPVSSTSDDELSLAVLERELEAALTDVREAKKKAAK